MDEIMDIQEKKNIQKKSPINSDLTKMMMSKEINGQRRPVLILTGTLTLYLRRLERIIWGEMNRHKKNTTRKRAVGRAHYGSLPMKHILTNRSCNNYSTAFSAY